MKEHLTIVKVGGAIIESNTKLDGFLKAFAEIDGHKILVHGGGRDATKMCEKMGVEVQMIDGRRITDRESLKVAVMTYAGWLNKQISAKLQAEHCLSLGLCGSDLNTIVAKKRNPIPIDYGFVGDVEQVNAWIISELLNLGIAPVFSAICHDGNGQLLNVNADTIASELAKALSSKYTVRLMYCFEKLGVLEDPEDESSVIQEISLDTFELLSGKKNIHSGMIPKLTNGFNALKGGANQVQIGQLEEMLKGEHQGTQLTL